MSVQEIKSLPKISFGVIVLNGEPFNRYCLKSLYPYAHEIIVVEGAVKGAEAVSTPDGHSTDETLTVLKRFKEEEDPENKIVLITQGGFWDEKDQMSEAYAEAATGDWLWQVDIDEFYKDEDMDFICRMLSDNPDITTVSIEQITFWGSPDYSCDSTYLQKGLVLCHRIFKWRPGYRYSSHRPPTIVDHAGVNLLDINPVSGKDLAAIGIYFYHYSLLFPKQVREKVSYYATWSGKGHSSMPQWMEKDFFGMENSFHLHNVTSHPGWLERFHGAHPKQIDEMWSDVLSGKKKIEVRPMDDVEKFIDSYDYRKVIMEIRSELRTRKSPDIKMEDPVIKNLVNPVDIQESRNIVQVSTNESRGGAALIQNCISEFLANDMRNRYKVKSFVKERDNEAPWCDELYKESIEKSVSASRSPLMDYGIASSFYLLEKPEFKNCDLVHLHNLHGYYFNPLTIPLISHLKPSVWTLHDMNSFTGHCGFSLECEGWRSGCKPCPHLDYYPQLKKDVANELLRDKRVFSSIIDTTLVCPSQWLADLVGESFLSELDCRVLPNGIDTNIFKPYRKDEARKIFGIPQDAFVLAMTAKGGMKNSFKGGEYLEKAGIALQQRHPNLILLNIGGEYYSDKVKIMNLPYIDDRNILALAYSAGDVFAYPSLADNHPLSVMEAMACGLPVVAFRTGGIPEQVIDGETGLIADYRNLEQLIMSLGMLMERPQLLKAMSIKSSQRGSSFTLKKMVDGYKDIYEDILERRTRSGGPNLSKSIRAMEYLQSRLAQVGNTAGVEAYKKVIHGSEGSQGSRAAECRSRNLQSRKKTKIPTCLRQIAQRHPFILELLDFDALLDPSYMLTIGTEYGGWSIPKDFRIDESSICYCAGAGEDISFDCELVQRFGCEVYIFDPTPKAIAHFNNLVEAVQSGNVFPVNNSESVFYDISAEDLTRIHFYPFGLSGKDEVLKFYFPQNKDHVSCSAMNLQRTSDYFEAECFKIRSLKNKFGHEKISLLKMDIEGAEYGVIRSMIQEDLPDLVCIEFDELHTPLDSGYAERISSHIKLLLAAGLECVFADGCDFVFCKTGLLK